MSTLESSLSLHFRSKRMLQNAYLIPLQGWFLILMSETYLVLKLKSTKNL